MSDSLQKLNGFFKAQSIRDPMGIATYVTERYGIPDKEKYRIARGIAGKSRARSWNKPIRTSDTKRKEKGQRRFQGDFKKAKDIKDTTRLAHHLAGGGAVGAKYKGQANVPGDGSKRDWARYEGGMKDKDRAKEWNPIEVPDERGYTYTSTGIRRKKDETDKQRKSRMAREAAKKQKRVKGKFGGREGAYQPKLPGFKSVEKAMEILKGGAVPKKFGGSPLKWEDLPRDPIAFATNVLNHKGFWYSNLTSGSKGAKLRNKLARSIRELIRDVPEASKKEQKEGKIQDKKDRETAIEEGKKMAESWKNGDYDMKKGFIKKKSPLASIAGLLGFGAGWAMSDTFVEAPRGQMTPSQQRDWERLVRSSMRRKKNLSKDAIDSLKAHYTDQSDTYVKKVPINNSLNIKKNAENLKKNDELAKKRPYVFLKDHMPIPPRQGLVWDEQKKHWTRPEHIGHTVSEVQGKKRIRGHGTGAHEHGLAIGQIGCKGEGSAERGRRFRSVADAGVIRPHDAKHPATHHLKTKAAKKAINSFLSRKKHNSRK